MGRVINFIKVSTVRKGERRLPCVISKLGDFQLQCDTQLILILIFLVYFYWEVTKSG